MSQNLLGRETSPYLLQHADNPVAWRAWGADALAEAAAAERPILLSVGYAACHWCHVMAHESFEDPAMAELMNALFVNIKVDREERPDLDAIYQAALALLGEQGGWPLTMFCTPAGEPFWGGTYFPPAASFGRPGFPDVLKMVARVYCEEPERVQHNVGALREAMASLSAAQPGLLPDLSQIDDAARRIAGGVDPDHGGLAGAPKFPQVSLFKLLWRAHRRSPDAGLAPAVIRTLDAIAQGGIYDHLGSGFARYSVDARWLVPHFEKMLYDNARLIELYTEVWRTTRAPLYAQRVAETVAWLQREMVTAGGGFAATIDADSEGEEGRYYV